MGLNEELMNVSQAVFAEEDTEVSNRKTANATFVNFTQAPKMRCNKWPPNNNEKLQWLKGKCTGLISAFEDPPPYDSGYQCHWHCSSNSGVFMVDPDWFYQSEPEYATCVRNKAVCNWEAQNAEGKVKCKVSWRKYA